MSSDYYFRYFVFHKSNEKMESVGQREHVEPGRRLHESACSQWQFLAQLSRTKDSRPKPLSPVPWNR